MLMEMHRRILETIGLPCINAAIRHIHFIPLPLNQNGAGWSKALRVLRVVSYRMSGDCDSLSLLILFRDLEITVFDRNDI
jgi:hypothetical protein